MGTPLGRGRFFGRALQRRRVGDLELVDSRHAAGSRLDRHTHEHAYFCVTYAGSYREEYGRRHRIGQPGLVAFHPAGEWHSEEHHEDVASLNVELGPRWLERLCDVGAPLDRPLDFHHDEIAACGLLLVRELHRDDADSPLAIEALTWEILAGAGRSVPDVGRHPPRWLRAAREQLDGCLHSSPSLRALASEAGVHPVHFAAWFRRFYGCSVGEYHRRRRFLEVRRRLTQPELTLTQVAAEAGFADQSHLTRTWKRLTGLTPSQYRTFLRFKPRRDRTR